MVEIDDGWFETRELGEGCVRRVSRFLRKEFSVPRKLLEEQWSTWTQHERLRFAGAFSARAELSENDQSLLGFLIENGDPTIWMTIALSVGRHRDRGYAMKFLLARVKEGNRPLANYYQALEMLHDPQSVPALEEALSRDRIDVSLHPALQSQTDRFIYVDYLSCSAALFKITGREEYRGNIEQMLQHPDEAVRKMIQMIVSTSDITLK